MLDLSFYYFFFYFLEFFLNFFSDDFLFFSPLLVYSPSVSPPDEKCQPPPNKPPNTFIHPSVIGPPNKNLTFLFFLRFQFFVRVKKEIKCDGYVGLAMCHMMSEEKCCEIVDKKVNF